MYTQKTMADLRKKFLDRSNRGRYWLIKDQVMYMFGEVRPSTSFGSTAILKSLFHNENLQLDLSDMLEKHETISSWNILIPVQVDKNAWIAIHMLCSSSEVTINIYDPSNSLKDKSERYENIIEKQFSKLYQQTNVQCNTFSMTLLTELYADVKLTTQSDYQVFKYISYMFNGCLIDPSLKCLGLDRLAQNINGQMLLALPTAPQKKKLFFIYEENNIQNNCSLTFPISITLKDVSLIGNISPRKKNIKDNAEPNETDCENMIKDLTHTINSRKLIAN